MQAPITYNDFGSARSILDERPARPPIIGKIRPGIKVLTRKARENAKAVAIHDALLAQGKSFEAIGIEIERVTSIKNPLVPKNTPYFTCRGSDFSNPDVADEILKLYGEDKGDGRRLWRFPVIFAFDDWLQNMPNQLVAWGAAGRKYFSEYGSDGVRYCKTYAPAQKSERASRAKRNWGGRQIILRQDNEIQDGRCDPHECPQYQAGACSLSASFFFAVLKIKGLGLIELPTTSIYVLQKAYAAMQTVSLARGRLVGVTFWVSKMEVEVSRIGEDGQPMRQKQWLITLDADIDLGALLDGTDRPQISHVEKADEAVAMLEATGPDRAVETTIADSPADLHDRVSVHTDVGAGEADHVDDLESQFDDLLTRVGLNNPEGREQMKRFANASFGHGWPRRPNDIRRLLDDMRVALANPLAFREQVAAVSRELAH
ncbi:recombination directionality factor [Cupriavidus basilensis]|uniref:recombination directionality factor n=1 Tax=Cupriavidus basilensis TaxID=68895 RepID=UPI0007509A15|nr:hypothetical protein [Cupriavidus basilensis]HVI89417.1 hypothetical protein [Dongiaceae bacterium]